MKRTVKILILAAVAILSLSACQKFGVGGSGKIWYSFGASAVSTGDLNGWRAIEDVYVAEFAKIDGAFSFESGGASFQMEGKYKSCDSKVVAACEAAEAACASKGLGLSSGSATLRMTATYSNAELGSKTIFEKTYGAK